MDLFRALDVSASGLAAQRARMDVISENLANSDSLLTPTGGPYRRKVVLLQAVNGLGGFPAILRGRARPDGSVQVARIAESADAPRRVYLPGHPMAGGDGFVEMTNVNPLAEMLEMLMATRAYEANAAAFQATKSMSARLIELLR
jgi:flagellar basal-body rod protein FlgC